MTREKQKYIEEMKKYTKRITSSKSQSQKFLAKTGVYTEKGKLKKAYK